VTGVGQRDPGIAESAFLDHAERPGSKPQTMVQRCAGLCPGGTPYSAIIRRRCRCLDCGQVRTDKEYA